jgi:hypothetical protein
MGRLVLVGFVVVLLAAGIVAYLVTKDGKAASSANSSQGTSTTVTVGDHTAGGNGGAGGPALPQVGEAVAVNTNQGSNPKDYVVGDIRVRDHRDGDNKPLDIPPNVHPAEGPAIPSTLTHEISQKVKTVVFDCAKDLPKGADGVKARLEGQISISIKAHDVTINKSTMELRDVPAGPAADAMKSCVEQKSVGLKNPAPDQADLDDYTINLSYALP